MNVSDLVNNGSVMKAGLRADTVRAETEYKNQLKNAGDIYVGTGEGFENDGEQIYITEGKNIQTALNEDFARSGSNVVLGNNVKALMNNSCVIGNNSSSGGENGIAIGNNVKALSDMAISLGGGSRGLANSAVALGAYSVSRGDYSISIGDSAGRIDGEPDPSVKDETKDGSINIGHWACARSQMGIAIGNGATISNNSDHSISIGDASNVAGNGSISIGNHSTIFVDDDRNAGKGAICIGQNASCNISSTTSTSVGAHGGIAIGINSESERGGVCLGPGSYCYGPAVAIGGFANVSSIENTEYGAVAIGINSSAVMTSIAIGNNAIAKTGLAIAIGNNSLASRTNSIAIGSDANSSEGGVVIGQEAHCNGGHSVAIGEYCYAEYASVAIGGANASGGQSVAIGDNSNASAPYSIAIGFAAKTNEKNNNAIQFAYATSNWSSTSTVSLPAGGSAWTWPSDERIKENIELANTAMCLSDINKIPVKRFSFKDFAAGYKDKHQLGFIAQDLEKIYPKLVNKSKCEEFDDPCNPGEKIKIEDFRSIEKEPLIPVLWAGVQELSARLEKAESKITEFAMIIDEFNKEA